MSLKALFNKAFPIYLSMGMTSAEFWEQDPALVLAYKEAHRLRFEEQNRLAWLQGRYVYDALCAASPLFHDLAKCGTTAAPYYDEPIKFYRSEEEKRQEAAERERARFIASMRAMMAAEREQKAIGQARLRDRKGGQNG